MLVKELSDRLRCLRNCHLETGKNPLDRRLEELLLRWAVEKSLEPELPDPVRLIMVEEPRV
jgi:hypothetical protein